MTEAKWEPPQLEGWKTVGEAADALQKSRQRVHQLVSAQEFPGARVLSGKRTLIIPDEDIEDFKKKNPEKV